MAKVSLKKLFDKQPKTKAKAKNKMSEKDKKLLIIAFDLLALFCIVLFCMAITPRSFQNDTFYTIKIGQDIRKNGIDYKDHYSWHENLPYMYPHWLYDVIISLVYDFCGGMQGLYIMTIIFSALLGISLYFTNKKFSKNEFISFVNTMFQMYLVKDYIAARAQLVTFILFVLTVLIIEKFIEKPKVRYGIELVLIPIIISNIHSAVFPFYFILYLPYLGEYVVASIIESHFFHKAYQLYLKTYIKITNKQLKKAEKKQAIYFQQKLAELQKEVENSNQRFEKSLIKQNDAKKNPYKIKIEKNNNIQKLFIIMIICLFTGLLSPLKDMPYTYTFRIMKGNTTQSISEHLPLTLINNMQVLITITLFIILTMFTKVKLKLRDWFFVGGLTLLAFMSRRQVSMLVLFGGLVFGRIVTELFDKYDKKGTVEIVKYMTTVFGEALTILLVLLICFTEYKPIADDPYINETSYPVQACEWIKENLDYKNIRIFNDYNYGSYMLFQDIPVFVDSRCDLYTPEFNGKYDKSKKKFEGQDIFSDYINVSQISTYYDSKFDEYGITHVITKNKSKVHMLISKNSDYKEIYKDNAFTIYERE